MPKVNEKVSGPLSNLRSRLEGVDLRQNAIFIALLVLIAF